MIVFFMVEDAPMLYKYRPAQAISNILQRVNDEDPEDTNQYPYVKVRYFDRKPISASTNGGAERFEWEQRKKQHVLKQYGDGHVTPTSSTSKPLLLIFMYTFSDQQRLESLCLEYNIVRCILHCTDHVNMEHTEIQSVTCTIPTIKLSSILTQQDAQTIYQYIRTNFGSTSINGIVFDYLHINDNYIANIVQPMCTLILPWLYCSGIIKRPNTQMYLPNVSNITHYLTSNELVKDCNWLYFHHLKTIYSVAELSAAETRIL
jgi:hypothetical protein